MSQLNNEENLDVVVDGNEPVVQENELIIDEIKSVVQEDELITSNNEQVTEETKIEEIVKAEEPQIENVEKQFKEKKKLSRNTKIIICLIVFIVLAIASTIFAIYYKTNKKVTKEIKATEVVKQAAIDESNLAITSLTERYSQNSLKTETKKYVEGPITTDQWGTKYSKIEINYITISGLKDKVIEDKINADIKAKAFSLYDNKYLSDNTIQQVNIYSRVMANFGNVISVEIQGGIYYINEKTESKQLEEISLNYRLDNGEQVKFEDLFIESANTNSIIANATYKALAFGELSKQPEENFDNAVDMNKINTSNYENEILSTINSYKQDKDIKFTFTPRNIYARTKGNAINISIEDCYSSVAIYKRYLSKTSLYKDTSLGVKNIFVLNDKSSDTLYMFSDVTDNLFVDCELLYDETNSKILNVIEKIKAKIDSRINEVKSIANKDKTKGISYKTLVDVSYNAEDKNISVRSEIYISTMSFAYYKENIHSLIAEDGRTFKPYIGGGYSSFDTKYITTKDSYIDEKYDLNGNIVVDKPVVKPVNIYGDTNT